MTENNLMHIQVELFQIGISRIENYLNYFDLSTISDSVFYSRSEAEAYILEMGK